MAVTREMILGALRDRLGPVDWALSLYEGGAAAWHRVDEWSDIDLGFEVKKGRLQEGIAAFEEALASLGSIDLAFQVPNPPAAAQWLYHVEGSSPFLVVDICFDEAPSGDCTDDPDCDDEPIETDVHGDIICHFDKEGAPRYARTDRAKLRAGLEKRLATLPAQFRLFQTMPLKELGRGNWVEALVFYHNETLKLLVELLRIRYRPAQSTFHTRYIYYDFPEEVVKRLERLYFVADPGELAAKRGEAEAWFFELLDGIDLDEALAYKA